MSVWIPLLIVAAAAPLGAASAGDVVPKMDYLHGFPGFEEQMSGLLRATASGLVFESNDGRRLDFGAVERIEAHARARRRALMPSIGHALAKALTEMGARSYTDAVTTGDPYAGLGTPLLVAAPFAVLLRDKNRHLLSVEYEEGRTGERRTVLFRSRKNRASEVKVFLDNALGLTLEHYRALELDEESQRRVFEAKLEAVGTWTASKVTPAGGSKKSRLLVDRGDYEIVLGYGYIGLRPPGQSWAKYRLPLRAIEADQPFAAEPSPIYDGGRLVGFDIGGARRRFD